MSETVLFRQGGWQPAAATLSRPIFAFLLADFGHSRTGKQRGKWRKENGEEIVRTMEEIGRKCKIEHGLNAF